MGFIQPNLPVVDMAEWSKRTRAERIMPMTRHIAANGFGTPLVMHVMYGVKIALYILGGWVFAWSTKGIDGFTDVAAWWTEPIVFQKAVLYTMLFEVVGLGCCFGPLAGRYFPPMGSILYWLRPGTIRLPPWPDRVPLTKGTNRTPFDAVLYGALLVLLVTHWCPTAPGQFPLWARRSACCRHGRPIAILSVLAVLGLRDKIIFLAARGEVYAPLALVFLFSGADIVVGAKVVFMVIWLGAATSKLNKHFPFVISTMLANNPFIPSGFLKRSLFKRYPDDLRPSALAGFIAHFSTAVEGLVPLVLFFSHGGWPTAIAAFVMVVFHLNILLAFPMGVPLEWNVFMIFGVLWLFVAHAQLGAVGSAPAVCRSPCCSRWSPAPSSSETCSRARFPSYPACGTTPATGTPRCGASSRRPTRRSASARARSARCITCSSSGCTRPKRKSWSPSTSRSRSGG